MTRNILGLAISVLAFGAAWGADQPAVSLDDPAAVRQQIMSNVGKAAGHLAAMAKGETPYDPRLADAAFRTINTASLGFGVMFPEGSETGADTEAAPAIWSDRAGFDEAVMSLETSSAAAIAAAPADAEAFTQAFGNVAGNCRACHDKYRIMKN